MEKDLDKIRLEIEEQLEWEDAQLKLLKDRLQLLHDELLKEGNTFAAGWLYSTISEIEEKIMPELFNHEFNDSNDKNLTLTEIEEKAKLFQKEWNPSNE